MASTGLFAMATPASATCIDYYQYEVFHTDLNNDGTREVVVYYPPIVTDVDPADCLRNEPEAPQIAGVDIAAVLANVEIGLS